LVEAGRNRVYDAEGEPVSTAFRMRPNLSPKLPVCIDLKLKHQV
jgi:hypothetical protein